MFKKLITSLFHKKSLTPKAKTGMLGEDTAVDFLKNKRKMKILERNYKSGKNEIDIIAEDGNALVFVEVKTRSESAVVDGYYAAMSKSKRNAVRKCANDYRQSSPIKYITWRFDVVDVRVNSSNKVISTQHFENVPY